MPKITKEKAQEKADFVRSVIEASEEDGKTVTASRVLAAVQSKFGEGMSVAKINELMAQARGEAPAPTKDGSKPARQVSEPSLLDKFKEAGPLDVSQKEKTQAADAYRKATEQLTKLENAVLEAKAKRDEAIRRLAEIRGGRKIVLSGQMFEFRGTGAHIRMEPIDDVDDFG